MAWISHVCLGVQNLYEAAHRLREETGLASYDGGWFRAGMANRIVPVGSDQYIEVESLIDPRMAEREKGAEYFLDFTDYLHRATEDGDALIGWAMRTDSLHELRAVADRLGFEVGDRPRRGRIRPDGSQLESYAGPPSARVWPRGLPIFQYRPDPAQGPGKLAAEHRGVEPRGFAWLEIGGDERVVREWLGPEGADAPVRLVGGEPGVRAVAVATDDGAVVVGRG
jgi:Glyoxalase-like domain